VANRGHGRVAVQESGGKSQEGRCIECVWRLRPLSSLRSLARRRRLQHRRSIAPCHGPPRRLETTLKEPWRRPPCVAGVSGELSLRAGLERLSAYRRASGPEWLDHHQAVEHRGLYRRCPGRRLTPSRRRRRGSRPLAGADRPFSRECLQARPFGNTPAVVEGDGGLFAPGRGAGSLGGGRGHDVGAVGRVACPDSKQRPEDIPAAGQALVLAHEVPERAAGER
jgi:hypothetical protein